MEQLSRIQTTAKICVTNWSVRLNTGKSWPIRLYRTTKATEGYLEMK